MPMPSPDPKTSPPVWCRALMAAERFLIRTLRVAGALVLGGLALWLIAIAVDALGQPFASLSPLGLIGSIVAGLLGLLLLVLAFGVAFGEKGESRVEAAWRGGVFQGERERIQSERKGLGYEE